MYRRQSCYSSIIKIYFFRVVMLLFSQNQCIQFKSGNRDFFASKCMTGLQFFKFFSTLRGCSVAQKTDAMKLSRMNGTSVTVQQRISQQYAV
jgi:hypothetical protein